MKILFICNFNQNRSVTAEELFKDRYETKSAGMIAGKVVTSTAINWADKILVMEEDQKEELARRYPSSKEKTTNLNIPNNYFKDQEQLKKLLEERVSTLLE